MTSDPFPERMEIAFIEDDERKTLVYEKVTWEIDGERKGLRYGENPDQPAAFYRLVNGNLTLGDVTSIEPGRYLLSDVELLQSGKHPGKINITDADAALNIMRYLDDKPCAVIIKHNNPSGVAVSDTISAAYHKALMADRIAAFGGVVACNTAVDRETASEIADSYTEVVVAPDYEEGCVELLAKRKNLRIMKIGTIDKLGDFENSRFLDAKSLIDGGIIVQWSYLPKKDPDEFVVAETEHKGIRYSIKRKPTRQELEDMRFGWLVESGVISNSVIFVKDGVTLGIGAGEQDRVGVADIAVRKAYRNAKDRLAWMRFKTGWLELEDEAKRADIEKEIDENRAGLSGSVMVSDAYFPKPDGVLVGLEQGVRAVIQPGGSIKDREIIEACNEYDATMVFTGQRSFKH